METSRARRSRARRRWETRAPVREIPRVLDDTRHPGPGRCVSPAWTERSRSRSPGASSAHSAGSSASDSASAYAAQITTHLNHLPAGRFVYGRRHLQPFEFSAFWHSAESNRAGTRPARSPEHEPVDDSRDGDAETSMAWGRSDAHGRARRSARERAAAATGGGFGSADRRKYSSTGSRGDAASTWRKKKPTSNTPPGRDERWTRRGEASEAGTWRAEAPSSAPGASRRRLRRRRPLPPHLSRATTRARSHVARPKRCSGRRGTRVVRGFSSRELGGVDVCSGVSLGSHQRLGVADPRVGRDGVAGRTPRAKRRARTLAATKRRDGGAHEGFDVAGHVARVRRRVRRARRGKRKGKEGRRGKGAETRGRREAANVWGSRAVYRYFVPVMETRVVSCCCLIVVETHARCASWAGRTRVGVKTFHRAVGQSGTDENHHATKSRRRSRRAHPRGEKPWRRWCARRLRRDSTLARARPLVTRTERRASRVASLTPARTASSRRARATDVSSLDGARNLLAAAAVPCRVR